MGKKNITKKNSESFFLENEIEKYQKKRDYTFRYNGKKKIYKIYSNELKKILWEVSDIFPVMLGYKSNPNPRADFVFEISEGKVISAGWGVGVSEKQDEAKLIKNIGGENKRSLIEKSDEEKSSKDKKSKTSYQEQMSKSSDKNFFYSLLFGGGFVVSLLFVLSICSK